MMLPLLLQGIGLDRVRVRNRGFMIYRESQEVCDCEMVIETEMRRNRARPGIAVDGGRE